VVGFLLEDWTDIPIFPILIFVAAIRAVEATYKLHDIFVEEIIPQPEDQSVSPLAWYEVWAKALFQPSVVIYEEIAANPNASFLRGFGWISAIGIVKFFHEALILVVPYIDLAAIIGKTIDLIYGSVIFVGIIHGMAKLFGGTGGFGKLYYTTAASLAPANVIYVLIPFLGPLESIIITYFIVLSMITVKAVHKLSWGLTVAVVLVSFFIGSFFGGLLF
jgi:hypothetical protein